MVDGYWVSEAIKGKSLSHFCKVFHFASKELKSKHSNRLFEDPKFNIWRIDDAMSSTNETNETTRKWEWENRAGVPVKVLDFQNCKGTSGYGSLSTAHTARSRIWSNFHFKMFHLFVRVAFLLLFFFQCSLSFGMFECILLFLPFFSMKSAIYCKRVICVHHWLCQLLVLLFCFVFLLHLPLEMYNMRYNEQHRRSLNKNLSANSTSRSKWISFNLKSANARNHTHTYRNVTTSFQQQQQQSPWNHNIWHLLVYLGLTQAHTHTKSGSR